MKNVLAALMFFTRLPFWRIATVEKEYFKNVVNYWPYAGIITGGIGAGVIYGASFIFPATVAVILGVASRVLVTGALHEDGLADFFDGFGGGTCRDSILGIMKDSHIGSYGVLGLVFYFALLVSVLSSMPAGIAAPLFFTSDVLGKSVASNLVAVLPYARDEQQSKNKLVYNKVPVSVMVGNTVFVMFPIAFVYTCCLPAVAGLAVLVPFAVFFLLAGYMKRKIQGYTGDCCGATFLLCELSFLLASLAFVNLF